jgi:ABC-type multidrug transport system fused ATPase/permease subunit
MTELLGRLWVHISSQRRSQLVLLLLLMFVSSIAEVVSIGAVIPFVAALTAPDKLLSHRSMVSLLEWLDATEPTQLQATLTIVFVLGVLIAGAVRLVLSWASTRLAYATGADLSYNIYWRTLCQPYSVHVSRNSSQIITAIVSKVGTVINLVINPVLVLINSVFVLGAISGALFFVNSKITLIAFVCFGAVYLVIAKMTNQLKRRNGEEIAAKSTQVVKALQEGLGGIRDILLDGSQKIYCDVYKNADIPLRRAQGSNQFIAQSPRFLVEMIGMILIAAIAYSLSQRPEGLSLALPVLGALAIGAQRMLPVMQQAYAAWSSLTSMRPVFEEMLILLEQPVSQAALQRKNEVVPFRRIIELRNVDFRYGPEAPMILNTVNLTIEKGSRIGIIGATGCGKSTLVDIIMGFLVPSNGTMEVDGTKIDENNLSGWRPQIAHVPQSIFLTDNSILENIAFGVPKERIDEERVRLAAAQAQIAADIDSWPKGYNTRVGERGICLSGGQRQRVGIARALYKSADIIVFDEATSALDIETEKIVMSAIDSLSQDLTIIIITHRMATLVGCTKVVEFTSGEGLQVRSYDEVLGRIVSQ